jgi:hypothetical protein
MKTEFETDIMILKAAIEKRENAAFRKVLLRILEKTQVSNTQEYYLKKVDDICLSLMGKRSGSLLLQGLENAKK